MTNSGSSVAVLGGAGPHVAVLGARGMLAAEVVPLLRNSGHALSLFDLKAGELFGTEVRALDLTRRVEVLKGLDESRPTVIYNLAAYTAVDAAEKDYNAAFAVNGVGPGILAEWAKNNGAVLVHISTDYVFGGDIELAKRREPIPEDVPTMPCGIYGESKRMGEELVTAHLPSSSIVVRTSWLHGLGGPNFVDTILRVLSERAKTPDRAPLRVVNDQFGSPTWCGWLAGVLLELVQRKASGVFHASSRGNISWQEFAQGIATAEKSEIQVLTQSTAELNRPAPRPPYSTLDVRKLEAILGRQCPSWQEGLMEHLRRRHQEEHA